ncbi:MAG: hypothetical protein RR137_00640 [Odoribacter sp.]
MSTFLRSYATLSLPNALTIATLQSLSIRIPVVSSSFQNEQNTSGSHRDINRKRNRLRGYRKGNRKFFKPIGRYRLGGVADCLNRLNNQSGKCTVDPVHDFIFLSGQTIRCRGDHPKKLQITL